MQYLIISLFSEPASLTVRARMVLIVTGNEPATLVLRVSHRWPGLAKTSGGNMQVLVHADVGMSRHVF
jgi:hypothetical protein